MNDIGQGIIFVVLLFIYFIPTIIAGFRKHRNAGAIFVLNILLGWTFLGWVAALVWSFTSNTVDKQIKDNYSLVTEDQSKDSSYSSLQALHSLKDNGVITQEEFNREKSKILN